MSPIASTPAHARLDRHRHTEGYAALVLEGGYCESGDAGRFRVGPGDILLHAPFEAHRDDFGRRETKLIDLPLESLPRFVRAKVPDPTPIVHLAERDPAAAGRLLLERLIPDDGCETDWPDLLAAELRADAVVSLAGWAVAYGLHPGSLSRGFRLAYGVSPQRYRLEARARRAARLVADTPGALADIAVRAGFADQAHMARAIRDVTGMPPLALRRS